jgi:hypothetical protein
VPAPSHPAPELGGVAILGSADLPGLGDQVIARVVEQQLARRLPGWRLTPWAPSGRSSVVDGGLGALPLPPHDDTAAARFARSALLTVVCPALPVDGGGWFAGGCWAGVRVADDIGAVRPSLVAVRDRRSRDLLHDKGIDADIAVVAHPGLFAGELVAADQLTDRRTMLRRLGTLPASGSYLVAPAIDDAVARLGADHVVALPADLVLADQLAVLAGAEAVVATDEHVAAVAAGLAVRWVLLDEHGRDRPAALEFGYAHQIVERPGQLAAALRSVKSPGHKEHSTSALAAFFDRLAEHADRLAAEQPDATAVATDVAAANTALRVANDRLRLRLLVERQRLAEPLLQTMSERDGALAERDTARADAAAAHEREQATLARLAATERELAAWRDTKLARWSGPLRDVYGKLRHR